MLLCFIHYKDDIPLEKKTILLKLQSDGARQRLMRPTGVAGSSIAIGKFLKLISNMFLNELNILINKFDIL